MIWIRVRVAASVNVRLHASDKVMVRLRGHAFPPRNDRVHCDPNFVWRHLSMHIICSLVCAVHSSIKSWPRK